MASVGCIKPLCDLLTVQDARVVVVILEGLENILRVGSKGRGVNPFVVQIEEAYGRCYMVCDAEATLEFVMLLLADGRDWKPID